MTTTKPMDAAHRPVSAAAARRAARTGQVDASAASGAAVSGRAQGRPVSALAQLEQRPEWRQATPEQRVLLQRIAAQRDRLLLQRLERKQAQALSASSLQVDADASLPQRLLAFARLHPAATASVGASLALMLGPRRLTRMVRSSLPTLLPLLARLRR